MKRLLFVFPALLALCLTMAAQDSNHFAAFGGYSLERIAPCGGLSSAEYPCNAETGFLAPTTSFNGWNAAFTVYGNRFFGATADFSGHYGSYGRVNDPVPGPSASRYSYMFGPHFAFPLRKFTPFAHILFGRTSESVANSTIGNYNQFSWAVGGGLDMRVRKHIAVRFADLDYESVHVPGNAAANGLRYSGGVVFRF
jgi:opacity protein-like surface antigen